MVGPTDTLCTYVLRLYIFLSVFAVMFSLTLMSCGVAGAAVLRGRGDTPAVISEAIPSSDKCSNLRQQQPASGPLLGTGADARLTTLASRRFLFPIPNANVASEGMRLCPAEPNHPLIRPTTLTLLTAHYRLMNGAVVSRNAEPLHGPSIDHRCPNGPFPYACDRDGCCSTF